MPTNRQAKKTHSHTAKRADKQTDKESTQSYRQTGRQTDGQRKYTVIPADGQTESRKRESRANGTTAVDYTRD